jgi:nitrile hydratase beta subunit
MNGPQDLGGQMGFGPVAPELNEPTFHAEWERRALGLTLCSGAMGHWNIDVSRHARESLHPADYYRSSYYEIWIKGLEVLLERYGFVRQRDFEAGRAVIVATTPNRVLYADDVPATLARGGPCDRQIDSAPRFAPGDRVRARNINPTGHTRLPRYARGKTGVIETVHGGFVFPDTNAHSKGEDPQRLYTVVFTARELWGDYADPTLTVSIDAFEPYLEPA